MPPVWKVARWTVAVPVYGLVLANCGAFATAWGAWKLVSLFLPSKYYHIGDDFLFEKYQQLILFILETVAGIQLVLYGDYEDVLKKQENIVWVSNHQSSADWIVCEILAQKQNSLKAVRYIMKDSIKYLPVYGWYFPQHNCVFVRRSGSQKDILDIEKQVEIYPRDQMPVWLVIFPEGTRYNPGRPDVIKKSQDFAKSANLPVLEHHLSPRVKAAWLSVNKLRGYIDAVYDVTIAYEESQLPSDLSSRKFRVKFSDFALLLYKRVHVKIRRVEIKDTPTDEESFRAWLHNLFVEKDKDISHFYSRDLSQARRFAGQSFCPARSTRALATTAFVWISISAAMIYFPSSYWVWTRSWAAVLLLGPVYAVLKR